jgi:hypothetical protein
MQPWELAAVPARSNKPVFVATADLPQPRAAKRAAITGH